MLKEEAGLVWPTKLIFLSIPLHTDCLLVLCKLTHLSGKKKQGDQGEISSAEKPQRRAFGANGSPLQSDASIERPRQAAP